MSYIQNSVSGSSGTVTSVTFTGDGVVLSSTPSAPVTTSGTLTATLNTQTANTVLAGPTSGGAVTPTFRTLVAADLPVGTGTVTSFSAGNLSPLFTTSVATPTTTPALSFALTNAGGGTVFGNNTASAGAPSYTIAPVLGIPGTSTGSIAIASSTASGKFTLTAPANAATPTLTLPTTSNVLAGQFAGDGTVLSATLAVASAAGTVTASLANAGGGTVLGNNTTGSTTPTYSIAPVLGIPGTSTGTIALASSTASGKFTLTAPASAATPTLTLPTTTNVLAGQLAGDGTVFSASLVTASAAGTITLPTPQNQTANTFFAGPTSGGAAAPTFRAIVNADIPSGTVLWNQIGSATGNLSLSNAGNTTTFNQTSAVAWLWSNTTAAVSGTAQSSPLLELAGQVFSGIGSNTSTWTVQNVCSNSTTIEGTSELVFLQTNSGSLQQSWALDVQQVAFGNGSTGGPFVGGGFGFSGTKATGSSYPDMIVGEGSGNFSLVPSSSTSVNVGSTLNFYSNAATTTNSKTWVITSGQNNATGNVNFTVQPSQNINGNIITLACANGTYSAKPGITLGGNGGGNSKNFAATSGVNQIAVSVGGISGAGAVTFNPASGTATFTAFAVQPVINQTSTASGSYTGILLSVTETSLKGSANKFLTMQGGTAGASTWFEINNAGIIDNYKGNTTVKGGVPSVIASSLLTAQSAAIAATTIYAVPATAAGGTSNAGLYRITWVATITTAASTSSVLGGTTSFQIKFTNANGDTLVKTSNPTTTVVSAGNTTGTTISGVVSGYAGTSTNIQYLFDYSSTGVTAMVYDLAIYVEALY